jgi:hypothetical protein
MPEFATPTANAPAAQPTPAATAAPVVPPATPIAPQAPATTKSVDGDAVQKRIEAAAEQAAAKARSELLSSLGAKDLDEARAALKRHQDAEEAQKSEVQRLVEAKTRLEAEAKTGLAYRDRLAAMVASQFAELSPEQKTAVEKLAGNDPLRVADALDVLRPTWAQPAAPPAAAAQGQQPATPVAPPQAPANAAPPAGAPPPNGQKTKWQEYDEMLRLRPAVAPYFYATHKTAIEASRPAPAAN